MRNVVVNSQGLREPGLELEEIAQHVETLCVERVGDAFVSDVQHDSRNVARGDLFVARERDGLKLRRFVAEARARGAAALMLRADAELSQPALPCLRVRQIRRAQALAAHAVHRKSHGAARDRCHYRDQRKDHLQRDHGALAVESWEKASPGGYLGLFLCR